jgi:hypothetical protein
VSDLKVEFDPTQNKIYPSANYRGGLEGETEWWWVQVLPDGIRVNLPKKTCPAKDCWLILDQEEHAGSKFKAKCRPQRSDGRGSVYVKSLNQF